MTTRSFPLATSTRSASSSRRVSIPGLSRIDCMNLLVQDTANAARTVGTSTKLNLSMRSTIVSFATTHPRSSDCSVCDIRNHMHPSDTNQPQRNATTYCATSARRSGGGRRARARSARLAPFVEHLLAWLSLRRAFMPTKPRKRKKRCVHTRKV